MRSSLAFVFALAMLPARADPANTLAQLSDELRACFADVTLGADAETTVVFSLKRDGSLNGKPRLSYVRLPSDPAERDDDAGAIARALDACLPLSITDGLGGAIAGRPIALRVRGRP